MARNITVIGSYNAGLFFKGQNIPAVGETLIGDSFYQGGGGKGSNQAIAAAALGGNVSFIGRIGRDVYGDEALDMYQKRGISTDGICVDESEHTGMSVILIDSSGHNSIMVVPGANYKLDKADIDANAEKIRNAWLAGFQLENQIETVLYGIKTAHESGVQTLLDPAPAVPLPHEAYRYITYIKPNEIEATTLSGISVTDYESAERAGRWFIERGVKHAIITLGEHGAVCVDSDGARRFDVPKLELPAIDSTGAGDTFSGALMTALGEDKSIDEAIRFAICAAALSVTRLGVTDAIPNRAETDALYARWSLKAQALS